MKKKTRLFCFLLALVMFMSALPLHVFAAATGTDTKEEEKKPATGTATIKVVVGKTTLYTYEVKVGDKPVKLEDSKYIKHKEKYYEFSYYTISNKKPAKPDRMTIPAFDSENPDAWQKKYGNTIKVVYKSHKHTYRFSYGRIFHWNICVCGDTTNEVRHVDPAKDADKICTCGYKFSNNADLTTLWFSDMMLSPAFNREITEYTAEVYTYKDVTAISFAATPFDALAKVEVPETVEIHEGANKFVFTVTAEDKTTQKTYTVIAVKPFKVEDTFIGSDGTTVSAQLNTTIKRPAASAAPSEAVAAKLLELAETDKASTVALTLSYSRWNADRGELTLPGTFLKTMAEKTEASLQVLTPYGTILTIPHSELASLAEGHEAVLFRVARDKSFAILADGTEIAAPAAVTLTVPEK